MTAELTTLSYFVIPTTVALLFFRPAWLLPWSIILSIFQAASTINLSFGDYVFGVQPGFFAAGIYVGYEAFRLFRSPRKPLSPLLRRTYSPLVIFGLVAAVSALVLPHLLAGVLVFPPRAGISLESAAPLRPQATNVSQTLFLAFLVALALIVSVRVAREGLSGSLGRAVMIAGIVISLVGLYQVIALSQGLPYPSGVINSNPAYAQLFEQVVGGDIPRLSSTLTEPSVAGYHLVGIFAFSSWLLASGHRTAFVLAASVLTGIALLMTTSTSGLLALVFVVVFFAVRAVRSRPELRRRVALAATALPIGAIALLLLWGVIAEEPLATSISEVFGEVVFEKTHSQSFSERSSVDAASLGLLAESFGMGVGWGSTRSASLFPNITANAGVWGLALLGVFSWRVAHLYKRAVTSSRSPRHLDPSVLMALGGGVLGMLVAAIAAVPDVTYLFFWFLLALLVGEAVRRSSQREDQEVRATAEKDGRG